MESQLVFVCHCPGYLVSNELVLIDRRSNHQRAGIGHGASLR